MPSKRSVVKGSPSKNQLTPVTHGFAITLHSKYTSLPSLRDWCWILAPSETESWGISVCKEQKCKTDHVQLQWGVDAVYLQCTLSIRPSSRALNSIWTLSARQDRYFPLSSIDGTNETVLNVTLPSLETVSRTLAILSVPSHQLIRAVDKKIDICTLIRYYAEW